MECSLDQALQGTLAILTKVRPEDLDGPTPSTLPAEVGPADQLAAFLGRAV
jgi:hypothetical protein